MSHSVPPTDAEVAAYVASLGITVPSGFSFVGYADAGRDEFERLTGWIPFVSAATASARTFDPPGSRPQSLGYQVQYGGGRVLMLNAGIADTAGLIVTVAGVSKTLGTDFRLLPSNAIAKGRPYTMVEFFVPIWGVADSVAITAKWGYCLVIPELAYQAMLYLATSAALMGLVEGLSMNTLTFSELDVNEKLDANLIANLGTATGKQAARGISLYMKVDQ